ARSVLGSARVRRGIVKSTKPETAMSAGLLTLPPCTSKNAVVSAEAKEGRHAGADQKDCRCGYAARRARHERRMLGTGACRRTFALLGSDIRKHRRVGRSSQPR